MTSKKPRSKWEEDAEFYADDSAPAWWEIGLAMIVMVLVIAILLVSSWGWVG